MTEAKEEKILVLGNNTNNDIWYYPKTDAIVNRKDGSTRNLFDTYNKIHIFPKKNLFYLGYENGDLSMVIPHKLIYLGFKNYNFKKSFVMSTSKRKRRRKGLNEERYIFEYELLEFNDDAEYAYFSLLMNDLINEKTDSDEIIELVDVSAIERGI